MKVFECIAKVQSAIAKIGIEKHGYNNMQNYKFRSIDDVYNAMAPCLASHGLCIIPKVVSREITERPTAKGGVLFYVLVTVDYNFVCSEDGSVFTATIMGEGMDSGDKATNKALTAAYKYLCLQTFCIPLKGEHIDSEVDSPEPIAIETVDPTKELYNTIVQKIKDRRLEDCVTGWKDKYQVETLRQLNENQMNELIGELTNV